MTRIFEGILSLSVISFRSLCTPVRQELRAWFAVDGTGGKNWKRKDVIQGSFVKRLRTVQRLGRTTQDAIASKS